jgi:hypothetical protein
MAAEDERPPFLGSWRRVYWLVVLALLLEIIVGTIVSRIYR